MHSRTHVAVLCLAASAGCGVLSTTTVLPPPAAMQTASRQDLINTVQEIASVQSLRATVDITLTVEDVDRTKETRYRNVRGALVTRRPGWIRTSGETPGGIALIYDMVSDGQEFQVYLPWRSRVYEGRNTISHYSENRYENLRPQHILDAVMLHPITDPNSILLDVETYGTSGYQVLLQVERTADGIPQIRRKYWFSRADLSLARMMILNEETEVETDAWYRDWSMDRGLPYPQYMRVGRPMEGYSLEIEILKPGVNEEIPDASFELALPDDIVRERVGAETVTPS